MQGVAASKPGFRVLSLLDDVTALGGVEAFQYDLAAALPKLGVEFRALNIRPKSSEGRQLPNGSLDYPASRLFRGPLARMRWRRFIRRFSPCFFLAHQPSSLGFLTAMLADKRWPVLSVVHNNSVRDLYWQNQIRRQKNILGYVAVSAAIRSRLVEEFGIESERVWTIPCGVSTAASYPEDRALPPEAGRHIVLLYAGRLATYAKQVLDLVGVAQALNNAGLPEDWAVSLHVVGDGPEAEELYRELNRNAGRVRLHLHGRIPREELFRIYEQAHFFILLSTFEGMPLALREAMSRGAVPVVTDIAAHREIITPGVNGFLFPVGDVAECARLCSSVAQGGSFEQVSRNAARSVRDHSVEATAAKYARLFEQLSHSAFFAGAAAPTEKLRASRMPAG
ncbi:MAG TPA: glycosyltransferase family 4 protein [Blastocatellia bacterium]|nr:glycosyltransferase family 4 protein [Blastocatellia bacterium]